MNNKRFLWAGVTLLLLASLFLAVQSVMAAAPVPCGVVTPPADDGVLRIKKTVLCAKDTTWNWDIVKSADQTDLTLAPGQTFQVNYEVTASAVATSNYNVNGSILIRNLTQAPVTINDVTDILGDVQACYVNGQAVTLPYALAGGGGMVCTYSGSSTTQPNENVATVNYGTDVELSDTVAINWSGVVPTSIDECADISDTYAGLLGTVCANGQQTFTFNYSRWIGPYDVCGEYTVPNTASFLTNDTDATGDSSWVVNVTVPCEGGCTLTPGYWKTHSIYGPAPYDDTWAQVGEDTIFFLSGKTYYNALWVEPRGNAYWILAHAYIAAQLNDLNGADFSAAQAAFDEATGLFNTWTPEQIGALRGNDPLRLQFLALATILDDYNNGLIGPGHCDE